MDRSKINAISIAIGILLTMTAAIGLGQGRVKPRVFLIDARAFQKPDGDALRRIVADADRAMTRKVVAIVSKEETPPSGDKHDYMSQAPYFWRNPNTANGLPYLRRDGERNPEIKKYPDHDLLDAMIGTVESLAIGYYSTRNEVYASRAAETLRMWFIDPATRMNPNLEFAQAIPGVNTGRGIGIIETRGLTRVVDSIGLLEGSKAWSRSDQDGVERWFAKYVAWLTESKNGKQESAAKNNHGTYYDVQLASFALFIRNRELARSTLEAAKQKRIALQIEKDGRQLLELERTKSWDYSVMNLNGLIQLATLGDHVGVDLWNFQAEGRGGIRQAILFLERFTRDIQKWPYKQITTAKTEGFATILHRAKEKYK